PREHTDRRGHSPPPFSRHQDREEKRGSKGVKRSQDRGPGRQKGQEVEDPHLFRKKEGTRDGHQRAELARAGIAAYRWSAFQQESETIYHQTGHLPGHKLGSPGIRGKVHYSNREETPMSICPILVREKRRRFDDFR